MSLQSQILSHLALQAFRPAWRTFSELAQGTSEDLREQQLGLMNLYLSANAGTVYGKAHGFTDIKEDALDAFRQHVPVSNGDSLEPYMQRITAGEPNILTSEPVKRLEPTSGTTGGSRLIPYTDTLATEFRRALSTWLYDLYRAYPSLTGGRSYWSITPAGDRPERSVGGLPVGFDDDTAYFGRVTGKLLEPLFVTDSSLARETDMEAFYFKTCLALLNAGDLRLMSFWNPSLALRFMDYIKLESASLKRMLPIARREALESALLHDDPMLIWPFLKVISCWTDAGAQAESERIKARFPEVHVQPKGLLATESFFSLPWEQVPGDPVLAATAHLFEFYDESSGTYALCDELAVGSEYKIFVTTGGGLYRYATGDIIRVTGHLGPLPRFLLLGRGDLSSDLHGEKLAEAFVLRCFKKLGTSDLLLVPHPDRERYILLTDSETPDETAVTLDRLLSENYHYAYCRRLGQLSPVEARPLHPDWMRIYMDTLTQDGKRLGDIKRPSLLTDPQWLERLHTRHK